MTYEKMRDALRSAVAEVVMGTYTWIRDFDDTTVWFEVEHGGMCHNYQCSYTVGADDMIELGQDRVEVSEVTSWEPVAMALAFEPVAVTKSADEQQIVFGWANVSIRKDGSEVVDSQGENVPIEDLETAAYLFTMAFRESGEDHEGEAKGTLVESVVFTAEKQEALGLAKNEAGEWPLPQGWFVGFHYPEKADYETAKNAKGMFSIQGRSLRVPVSA